MKKNIILFALLLLLPIKVKAYSKYDCTYVEQARLRNLASNVTTSYSYIENN